MAGSPVRVLHIIKTLGLGGAETNLLNLVRAFDPARVETHVAYSYGGEIEPRFREAGVKLFKYAERSHRIKSPHSALIIARLASYIRRRRIDVVQTHNFNGHVWGLLAAKLGGAKVIEHVHDFRYTPADELARRHGLIDQYRFIKHFRQRSDRVVVLTDAHRDYVVAHGIADAEQVLKLQNGITTEAPLRSQSDGRMRLGIGKDAFVVLTSARMDPTKNVELIVRIAPTVIAAARETVFVVAGSGDLLVALQTRVAALGLANHVRLIGFQPYMDDLLAIADVFMLPSFLELHSIAILEAQRMAVPIVVSKGVGCNDEFVQHGLDGFLCDPFEDAPWIDALLECAQDALRRRAIGEAGRDVARQRFDLASKALQFEKLYTELAIR